MTDRLRPRSFLRSVLFCSCLLIAGCGGPPENSKPAAEHEAQPAAANQAAGGSNVEANPNAGSKANPTANAAAQKSGATPSEAAPNPPTAASPPVQPSTEKEQPFTPPATLAELDQKVQWEDRPVLNSNKLLADYLAQHKPLVSVQQALAMKNNSPSDNEKILSALGRLPEGGEQPDAHAHLARYLMGDINSANPIMEDTTMEFEVLPLSTFNLMAFDWNLEPYADADVVEKWQSSTDHMIDKIVMRRDCTWSDGKPITAHDVVFTFHAVMNEKIPVPAVRTDMDKIRDVVAYDDYTVVFFHKTPLATNKWYMNFGVIPQHIFESLYAQLDHMSFEQLLQTPEYQETELHPISGYAYTMVDRVRNQEIVFKRRDDWYLQNGKQVREKPFFEEVRFEVKEDPNTALLALKRGSLDEFEIQQEQWATQTNGADFYDKNIKVYGTEWLYMYFGWNNNEPSAPYFADRRVREAMSYAFDYRELLDKVLFGLCQQCTGNTHPEAWYAPKTPLKPYTQDLDKAAQLLDEAGWTDSDGDGIRDKLVNGQRVKFEFDMIVKNDPERIKICEIMQFNLKQLGITCNIQPMEGTRLFDKLLHKQFQAEFSGWGTGSDPGEDENVWATSAIPPAGRNYLSYSNPEVDRLFEAGAKEFDREKRAAIYAKIDELIYRDQPCTFLYWLSSFYGYNKNLRGYKFSPRGPYNYNPGFNSIWKAKE